MYIILLLLTLFLLFYILTGGALPDLQKVKDIVVRFILPAGTAAGVFLITTLIFGTPFAGLFWAILGWLLPAWIGQAVRNKRRVRLHRLAIDFITSAAGLYAAGQVTPEVITATAKRFPEPFASEFKDMLAQREGNKAAIFPSMFRSLALKYNLPEFAAVASILSASETAGGPKSAAAGLKRLGTALRQKDRLLTERNKALIEVRIAGIFVISVLIFGLVLDVTALRSMFAGDNGKVVLGLASGIVSGLIIMYRKISQSPDLA